MKAMTCLPTLTKPVSAQVDALALGEGHERWREERPLAISSDSSSSGASARNREEVNFARERGQNAISLTTTQLNNSTYHHYKSPPLDYNERRTLRFD